MRCSVDRLVTIVAGLALVAAMLGVTSAAEAQRRRARRTVDRDVPAPVESAGDAEARALFLRGEAAYDAGRYEEALADFARAHELSGRPGLLFNIASVSERLRHDEEALRSYEAYLAAMPDAPNREFVASRIAFLEEQMARAQPAAPEPEPETELETATEGEPEPAAATTPAMIDEGAVVLERPRDDDAEALRSPLAAGVPGQAIDDGQGGGDVVGEWWLWALIGVAVVGAGVGIGVAVAASDGDSPVSGDFGPGGVIVALGSF